MKTLFLLEIAFFLGVIIGAIINLKKIGKWGPKRTGITNLLVLAFALIILFLVGLNPYLSTIPFLFVGFGYIGALITTPVLMGDVIDNDEIITGKRREAIYGGVNAVVTKPAVSIANSSFLAIIGVFGFITPIIINGVDVKQTQSTEALIGILVAFCIFPSIFLIISALILLKYPLDGNEWLQKKNFVMKLHEKKEKEYLESLVHSDKPKN
jgi:glycoside/pentoside/hexuronide:cation symporter, GPH family